METQRHYDKLSSDLEELYNSKKFFETEKGVSKSYLKSIQKKIKEMENRLQNTVCCPTLLELGQADREGISIDLEWIISDLVGYLDVARKPSPDQQKIIAEEILLKFPNLTLEDVVLCLEKAKDGQYGDTFHRLDGMIIKQWLNKYSQEKKQVIAEYNYSLHVQSKTGISEGQSAPSESRKERAERTHIAKIALKIQDKKKK